MRTREHKYGAKATVVDGIRFASQKEAKRYGELKMLEKAGKIQWLQLQPEYKLYARNCTGRVKPSSAELVGIYMADFGYHDIRADRWIVEDVKGFKTPLYRWKKKHVMAQYGITIRET